MQSQNNGLVSGVCEKSSCCFAPHRVKVEQARHQSRVFAKENRPSSYLTTAIKANRASIFLCDRICWLISEENKTKKPFPSLDIWRSLATELTSSWLCLKSSQELITQAKRASWTSQQASTYEDRAMSRSSSRLAFSTTTVSHGRTGAYLVHEFPTFLHGLFVHSSGLVMGVVEVMVRLKRVLHHANEPAAFLQISCHVSAPQSRTAWLAVVPGRADACPLFSESKQRFWLPNKIPPGEDSARVHFERGSFVGGRRKKL